jgi:hypothetical protein
MDLNYTPTTLGGGGGGVREQKKKKKLNTTGIEGHLRTVPLVICASDRTQSSTLEKEIYICKKWPLLRLTLHIKALKEHKPVSQSRVVATG